MPNVIDPRNIRPEDLRSGQVALFVVKVMITRDGHYRVYNCGPMTMDDVVKLNPGEGIPQGCRVIHGEEICQDLFPTCANHAEPDW